MNKDKDNLERWFRDNEDNIESIEYNEESNTLLIRHSNFSTTHFTDGGTEICHVEED